MIVRTFEVDKILTLLDEAFDNEPRVDGIRLGCCSSSETQFKLDQLRRLMGKEPVWDDEDWKEMLEAWEKDGT